MERQPVVAMADYTANATYVRRAWDLSDRYVVAATIQSAGCDFAGIIRGLVPSMILAIGAVMTTTALGATIGAGLGALGGGVGAAPGAVAGGNVGLTVGLAILDWFGLAFLAIYIGSGLSDIGRDFQHGIQTAWTSGGAQPQIDAAARQMADGVGRFSSLLLQAVFAYVAAEGIAAGAKRLGSSRLGVSVQKFFSTDAFEQAFGKYLLERTKPLPNGSSALGRLNEPPMVQRRAGKAAKFFSRFQSSIRNDYVTNVFDFLKTVDLSQAVETGSGVLKVGDELVRYRVGASDNPASAMFLTKVGTSPTDLAISWNNRTLVRYRVKAAPPDVLKSNVTGIRLGKPGARPTGHFSDSAISGGTGTQYIVPNWSAYLEEVKQVSFQKR
jgi:hypothetical protein